MATSSAGTKPPIYFGCCCRLLLPALSESRKHPLSPTDFAPCCYARERFAQKLARISWLSRKNTCTFQSLEPLFIYETARRRGGMGFSSFGTRFCSRVRCAPSYHSRCGTCCRKPETEEKSLRRRAAAVTVIPNQCKPTALAQSIARSTDIME